MNRKPDTDGVNRSDIAHAKKLHISAVEVAVLKPNSGPSSALSRLRQQTTLLVVSVCTILIFAETAWGCPNCKDNLNGDSATAFAASILFMMSMPFAIFGGWIVSILRLRRRIRSDG